MKINKNQVFGFVDLLLPSGNKMFFPFYYYKINQHSFHTSVDETKVEVMTMTKEEMIEFQIKDRNITDQNVINAMWEVERADFVPDEILDYVYEDGPLPIGEGQTISQPYIVAYMAQHLKLNPDDKVLEIGTGCGYNAAILSRIASKVYSIEIIEWLAGLAKENLNKSGIQNVKVKTDDGYNGWEEEGPFDAIILTAAPSEIPEPLKRQLKIGGRLLAPVGENVQNLILLEKTGENTFVETRLMPVRFVPMTGEAEKINIFR